MSNAAVRPKPFIRQATLSDIKELSLTMRKEDMDEIYLSSGSTPLAALTAGFYNSNEVCAIEWEGKVMAIFGVVGERGRGASPWMLGAPGIERCRSLLRECRKVLQRYTQEYRYLENACWCKNSVHIQWIGWLGFTFSGSDTRNGELFLHFHKGTYV